MHHVSTCCHWGSKVSVLRKLPTYRHYPVMSEEENNREENLYPCHVCSKLLPLLNKVNSEIKTLESQQPRVHIEDGLRYDVDRVFDSLYTGISQRESELLEAVEEHCGHFDEDDDLTPLLENLENAKSYCDKALLYTTKPELLHLAGMIHSRAEELLSTTPSEDASPIKGFSISTNGLDDLLSQIESFGKVFNVADVDTAVKEKSFPREQTALDAGIMSKLLSLSPGIGNQEEQENDASTAVDSPKESGLAALLTGKTIGPSAGAFGHTSESSKAIDISKHDLNKTAQTGPEMKNGLGNVNTDSADAVDVVNSVQQASYKTRNNIDDESNSETLLGAERDGNTGNESNSQDVIGTDKSKSDETSERNLQENKAGGGTNTDKSIETTTSEAHELNTTTEDSQTDGDKENGSIVNMASLLTGDVPSGVSPLAFFISSKYDSQQDQPATFETMTYSLDLDPDSHQDAILTIVPKMYAPEHVIKCAYMEFDKATVYEDNHVTRDGKLVNEPPILPLPNTSWRFKNYKGALSTRPLDSAGISYLEFWTEIEIKQIHGGRSLIFEAAVADRNAIDLHHKAEKQENAWGLSLSNCPTHGGLCRRTWGAGRELEHYPHTLPNEPNAKAQLRFGFLFFKKKNKLVVIDCKEEKVLMKVEDIWVPRPLWPVFGVYNTDLSYVQTTLVSSTDLHIDKNIAWLLLQNI